MSIYSCPWAEIINTKVAFNIVKSLSLPVTLMCIFTGCSAIKETSKYQLQTGIYKVRKKENKRFYTSVNEDKIILYPTVKTGHGWLADTLIASVVYMNSLQQGSKTVPVVFIQPSFDIDVITILFKYRPNASGFPNQLNTNFNAAAYMGYRSDLYVLSYDRNPLNTYLRRISHFGYSVGFFCGLGATSMNPFVTNNQINSEYDGVVITKGIAGLIAIGDFTFGISLGLDHLMDKNYRTWIYQRKLWAGFTVGLNLN